ncbi:MAG: 1,4-dihydroxy-6-naphthoate synthase [Bacteroidota bacterium]|nr:1,4-dihydroxy-6-naphthoate synthase [Bacteroidota bacterium]
MKHIKIGYSPCPNDCFIFDALVHKKIDTGNYSFEPILEDVETLNKWAMEGKLPVTKLSYHALVYVLDKYALLKSGSALGFNCGPLLISKKEIKDPENEIKSIAIPGKLTTANFLLSIAYPKLINKTELIFNEIEDAVINGKFDAGLIIHENRFTYEQKGLKKVCDLGEFWDGLIHAPIPLGGIVASKALSEETRNEIGSLIKQSVQFAFANPESAMPYVKKHAQEMSEEIMKKHIALYVNEFSIDLGEVGMNAVNLLFNKAKEVGLVKEFEEIV